MTLRAAREGGRKGRGGGGGIRGRPEKGLGVASTRPTQLA